MDNPKVIARTAHQFFKFGLWIVVALTMIALITIQVIARDSLIYPLLFTAVYSLLSVWLYKISWKAIAVRSPQVLTRFYLTGSVIQMILALIVETVGILVLKGNTFMVLGFAIMFAVFYLLILTYECIFFSRIEKLHLI